MALPTTMLPALPSLLGARVQRVDSPWADCLSITLFEHGSKQVLLLMFAPSTRGVGTIESRPKGLAASAFVQRLRTHLEGGRVATATWLARDDVAPGRAHALVLGIRRGDQLNRLAVDFDAQLPNAFLLRDDDTIAGASDERRRRERFPAREATYAPTGGQGVAPLENADELRARGEELLARFLQRGDAAARARAEAVARSALKKVERKIDAIRGDIARAETAPELRAEGQALLCHLRTIQRGATSVRLLDESCEPARWLEIALDPARDAQQNAQRRFERARKLERGLSIAAARLLDAEGQAQALRGELLRLANGEPLSDESAALRPLHADAHLKAKRTGSPTRVAYRVFVNAHGRKILVGKGAADNDTLTLTVARPHDHWLHVRGVTGSHVVVPLERKETIGQELLLDAAHLAAHFSKARGEPLVEIAHTERRFVRKLKGTPPGSVNVDRERVFVLRTESARLRQLLASEQRV